MSSVTIRSFEEKDAAAVSEFMKRCFLSQLAFTARSHEPGYYAWKYKDHGLGPSIVRLAEEDGNLVGFFGVVPKRFWMEGEECPAGELVDAFIDPGFQGRGVFHRLAAEVFEAAKNRLSLLLNAPNDLARGIYLHVYRFQPAFDYVSLVRPIRYSNVPVGPKWFRPFLGTGGRAAGWIFDCITLSGKSNTLSFQLAPYPDSFFDEFWFRNRSRFDFSLVKNGDYLRWRFFENPEPFEVYWILRNGERVGWFVLKLNTIQGLRFGHLVDCILPSDRAELRVFGVQFIRWLKTRDIDWVSTWAPKPSAFLSVLKGIGFFARKKHFGMIVRGLSKSLPEGIDDPEHWSFGQADTDNI